MISICLAFNRIDSNHICLTKTRLHLRPAIRVVYSLCKNEETLEIIFAELCK